MCAGGCFCGRMPSGCLISPLSPWQEQLAPGPTARHRTRGCRPTALQGALWSLSWFQAAPGKGGGAFVSRQNTLDTAHRAQALFTSVPALRKVASFPRRAQKKGLGANALGAGGIPLPCGSPQPRRAVKTPLLGCPGCRGALATCSPPLPSPCWQGTAGPSAQLRNNCCFSSPVNLARRSRFDQCTWIPAFSLDQGRRRDGRERALAGSLGTAWEAELLLQEKPASK